MQYEDDIYCLDIPKERSSLIKRLEYNGSKCQLAVFLRYSNNPIIYEKVSMNHYEEMISHQSIGKYYLHFIKPNFKTINSKNMDKRQPNKINIASDKVRWIDISINVREIKKEWLTEGEKGTYLNVKLRMLPDGTVDKFGNLGMIVQSVPTEIYKAAEAKEKGSGKKIEGVILGNAAELDWGNSNTEGMPGQQGGTLLGDLGVAEDLPF